MTLIYSSVRYALPVVFVNVGRLLALDGAQPDGILSPAAVAGPVLIHYSEVLISAVMILALLASFGFRALLLINNFLPNVEKICRLRQSSRSLRSGDSKLNIEPSPTL